MCYCVHWYVFEAGDIRDLMGERFFKSLKKATEFARSQAEDGIRVLVSELESRTSEDAGRVVLAIG